MYFVWALAITGFLLIFLEFFLPSAMMAIGGGLLLVASLFFFHMANPNPYSLFLYTSSLLCVTLLVVWIAVWKVNAAKKKKSGEETHEGFQALIYPMELIGKTGIAASDLKPSGQVWIEEKRFEAHSNTGPIEKGAQIQVVSGKGPCLLVKRLQKESNQVSSRSDS